MKLFVDLDSDSRLSRRGASACTCIPLSRHVHFLCPTVPIFVQCVTQSSAQGPGAWTHAGLHTDHIHQICQAFLRGVRPSCLYPLAAMAPPLLWKCCAICCAAVCSMPGRASCVQTKKYADVILPRGVDNTGLFPPLHVAFAQTAVAIGLIVHHLRLVVGDLRSTATPPEPAEPAKYVSPIIISLHDDCRDRAAPTGQRPH